MKAGQHVPTAVLWLAVVALSACSREEAPVTPEPAPVSGQAAFPVARVANGAKLFQQHCAECHGPEAQGHPDWQNPKVVVAPPLDGNGPVAQRSHAQMAAVIKRGASRKGVATMPAWGGRLSAQEVDDIILWFQALWPSEVYANWQKTHNVASTPSG